MKTKFFKIKKNYKEENFKINPNTYWKILMALALLLIIGSFIFSYNLFVKINKENDSTFGNEKDKIGNKEKEKINSVLEYFSEREKKSVEILNSPASVVDPSL